MELLNLELEEEIVATSTEIEFTADFVLYTLEGSVDMNIKIWEEEQEELNIFARYYLKGLTFWYLKVKDIAGDEISLNRDELQECKNDIENEIDKLIQQIEK